MAAQIDIKIITLLLAGTEATSQIVGHKLQRISGLKVKHLPAGRLRQPLTEEADAAETKESCDNSFDSVDFDPK